MTGFSKFQKANDNNYNNNKKFKPWSRKWQNLWFACWNCWSYSNERHAFCKGLKCDVHALTELHNKQNNANFSSDLWVPSVQAAEDEQGKSLDPAAGVTILLSKRMRNYVDKSGHVDTRIAWVRIRGPVCPIFFITVYTPHRFRTKTPTTQHTRRESRRSRRRQRREIREITFSPPYV